MIALSLLLAVLLGQDAPAVVAVAPPPSAPVDAHVQTTAEWVVACKADTERCQFDLGRSVVNRARMAGEYGCAELTDDQILAATLKWIAKHKDVADLPAKEGIVKATEGVWPCLKPKFQGRIP